MPVWLAAAAAGDGPLDLASAAGGPVWWQVVGGLALVFGLLLLVLRLLGRWQQRTAGRSPARVLAVWPLGPRREVQVLKLGDEVHYLYRQEAAMVHLRSEPLADWRQTHPEVEIAGQAAAPGWARWLPLTGRPVTRS